MAQISNHLRGREQTDQLYTGEFDRSSLSVFILPSSVYNAFTTRNNLVDIASYGKLRSVFSAVDIAELKILRNLVSSQLNVYSHDFTSLTDSEKIGEDFDRLNTELVTTIRHYEEDAGTIDSVKSYLTGTQNENEVVRLGAAEAEPDSYRIVYLQNTLYIIVEEGFLSTMADPAKRLAFLSRVLESAYAISPVSRVNCTSWYRQYLAALVATV